ncbi:MAG: serine/threonine-protein kinase, partial [Planctomycetota bacterium]
MSPHDDTAPHSDDDTLEALLFDTLERVEVEGSSAVTRAISEHPEHGAELRRRIVALRAVGLVQLPGLGPELEVGPTALPEVIGPYALKSALGEGGMGLVFAARDSSLDRDVAIKLIRPELVARGSIQERFQREARVIARLQHPGVVRVIEAGRADGVPYLAMERVRGCTLAAVLDALRGSSPTELTGADLAGTVERLSEDPAAHNHDASNAGPGHSPNPWVDLGWAEAIAQIHRDLAEGLEQAHAAGVLHRDVKASNVMLTPEGRALLIDFGLAWVDASTTLTATQGRLGSLPYTAPEEITSAASPTAAGDVYSLGVVLYESLTLALPFRAGSEAGLTRAIEAGAPEPPGRVNRSVPAPIVECVQRALRRDPRRRPPSAAAFAHDLSRALRGLPPVPHGDGAWSALSSAWRAQPFVAFGLGLAAALLLTLPATLLALRARTLEDTSASARLSVARLGIAAQASEELRASFPRSSLLAGSPLGELRDEVERDASALRALCADVGVALPPAQGARSALASRSTSSRSSPRGLPAKSDDRGKDAR